MLPPFRQILHPIPSLWIPRYPWTQPRWWSMRIWRGLWKFGETFQIVLIFLPHQTGIWSKSRISTSCWWMAYSSTNGTGEQTRKTRLSGYTSGIPRVVQSIGNHDKSCQNGAQARYLHEFCSYRRRTYEGVEKLAIWTGKSQESWWGEREEPFVVRLA